MKLLGRKKGREEDIAGGLSAAPAVIDAAGSPDADARGSRRTDPKGRPTPKRNDARHKTRKGPVAPAPKTASEARAPMPTASLLHDRFIAAIAKGRAEMDWSALALGAFDDAGLKEPR